MAKTKKPAKAAKKVAKAKSAKPVRTSAKPAPKKKAPVKKAVAKKEAPKKTIVVKKETVTKKTAPTKAEIAATKPKPTPPQLGNFPMLTQRPIAHKPAKSAASAKDERTRYSDNELKEFETLINEKLDKAKGEYKILKDTLSRDNDSGTDSTSGGNTKVLEDGAETAEKENLSQLAARQQKFIMNLENALVRIKNGTYGICSVTGKLISKERLIAVPHTTQSIEAKMMKKD
jgi:RNA polymerase-binding transcription factor DksA